MIYIYNDFGGTHTSAIAAAYHLNLIKPSSKTMTKEEILAIPYFNKLSKKDAGKMIFHGKDEDDNPVYTIGIRYSKLVVPALSNFSLILKDREQLNEKIIFSSTSPTVPLAMTLGGFFSSGLKIDFIGVPLLVMGAKQCYRHIFQLVDETKQIAKEKSNQRIIILDNKKFQA
ncbi:DUF3189 family protein [Peribacillus alkalitolerans]|uniref:DUF3189 family protein n=1 Tax=Peribacillus alkalitolerans TaxID=1550385 RepID=UPI0013D753B6|nr:DUF3189 family protein [Peribacillus alkalitolerans]